MQIHKLVVIALSGLAPILLAHATAAAEGDAKIAGGKVGVKRSQDKFKEELDAHVSKELTCSVTSAAIGQYSASDIPGVRGQFVGCHAPTPVCFEASEKREDGKKAFLAAVNTRWGSDFKQDLVLPTVPECAIPTTKTNFNLNVSAKSLPTDVKAWIEIKFDMKYINSQKLSFAKNNTFPNFMNGSSYPRANGAVITAYANYDRSFSFAAKVEYANAINNVDVALNLDYAQTNVHYCESQLVIADEPKAVDCPKK